MEINHVWKNGVVFSFKDKEIVIRNLVEKRKFKMPVNEFRILVNKIHSEDVRNKLVENKLMEAVENRNFLVEKGIQHWEERKWIPSIDLYLASRNISYSDEEDNGIGIRNKIQKKYGKIPKRNSPENLKSKSYTLSSINKKKIKLEDFLLLLKNRRSIRKFSNTVVKKEQLFSILYNGSQKIRKTREYETENFLYSYGSAFEIYIAIYNVSGIEHGIYYYSIEKGILDLLNKKQLNNILPELMSKQPFSRSAGYTIFLVVNFEQYQWRYRHERGIRNLYIEAGRIMQEFLIESMIQGVDGVVTPALKDTNISKILCLDYKESVPIYSYTCGIK